MKVKYTFFIAILNIILSSSLIRGQIQTTVTIRLNSHTGQDAYIADNYLNVNWGNHPDLASISWSGIGAESASARGLFQFYLSFIPFNANIIDARLSLFANPTPVNPSHSGQNASYIRRVVSPWNTNTVTWNSHPDYTYHNQVFLPQSISPSQNYLNINVTNLVRDMIMHPGTAYGFILMLQFEYPFRSMNFASSECPDSTKRPLLQITYGQPLSISNISGEEPTSFKIYQNYPNPFNPITNIKFDLPKASFSKIFIFDILGRELEILLNERLEAGSYAVMWDATKYSSGEYLYRIQSGEFIETKRMTLLK